jgi:phosphoribosylamine---glycine ligase
MTRVLIVGTGAREHALAWKLDQSPDVEALYVAPGNPGTAPIATNVQVAVDDVAGILRLVEELEIGLTVIGPELPLALGLGGLLRGRGHRVVGPDPEPFRLESSKTYAKRMMLETGVPTAEFASFDEMGPALDYLKSAHYPVVVKADGLAAGKGVSICRDVDEARSALRAALVEHRFGHAGREVLIEEFLEGPEVSLLCLVDGTRVAPLPVAQDHKRLGDGDTGPNTGGMGAYAPVPFLNQGDVQGLVEATVVPVIERLAAMNAPYRGVIFAGLILTKAGPRVLEYNCRFGDPEAQVVLPLVAGDLLPWLEAVASGKLTGTVPVATGAALGVVLASRGYPEAPQSGARIHGLNDLPEGVLAFHAATALDDHAGLVSAGGRVLTLVGHAPTVAEAARRAYGAPLHFEGMQKRNDIGRQAREGFNVQRSTFNARRPPVSTRDCAHPVNTRRGSANNDSSGSAIFVGSDQPMPHQGTRGPGRGAPLWPPKGPGIAQSPSTPNAGLKSFRYNHDLGRPRLAVLASGEGSNLQALIDACSTGVLGARIAGVISHSPRAPALARARRAGIPAAYIPITSRRDAGARRKHEEVLLRTLTTLEPDLIVLAGWMLVLSPVFLAQCPCPILNVHPALLSVAGAPLDIPVLQGAHAVRDALQLGLPYTGVSVHRVTEDVDGGPVLRREPVDILPGDDECSLHSRLKMVEHRLLIESVRELLDSSFAATLQSPIPTN